MDSEFKKLLNGDNWAESGDRAEMDDTSIKPIINRSQGLPLSFELTDTLSRRRFNQILRELYGGAKEVALGIPQYDQDVSYPIGSICQVNGELFYANIAHNPSLPVHPKTNNQTTWHIIGSRSLLPRGVPRKIIPSNIYIDSSRADRFTVWWDASDHGGYDVTESEIQYGKSQSFNNSNSTTQTYVPGTRIDISGHDADLYYIRIRTRNQIGWSSWSDAKQVYDEAISPNSIQTLQVVSEGNGIININWLSPESNGLNITSYRVQWKSGTQNYTTDGSRDATTTNTSYTISNLSNGTAYTIQVLAISNRSTTSPPSNQVAAIPIKNPDVPGKPSLGHTGASITEFTCYIHSVDDNNAPITRYQYQIKLASGSWLNADDIISTSSITSSKAHKFTRLESDTQYHVRARAYNGVGDDDDDATTGTNGWGGWGPNMNFTTLSYTAPGTPTIRGHQDHRGNLYYVIDKNIDPNGGKKISLYQVRYKKTTDDDWQDGGDGSRLSGIITGIDNTADYNIEIRATNGSVYSGWGSRTITASATAPSNIVHHISSGPAGKVIISLGDTPKENGSTITEWSYFYKPSLTLQYTTGGTSTTNPTFTSPALTSGASYDFKIEATNAVGTTQSAAYSYTIP